jgi:hypothetical protein
MIALCTKDREAVVDREALLRHYLLVIVAPDREALLNRHLLAIVARSFSGFHTHEDFSFSQHSPRDLSAFIWKSIRALMATERSLTK